MTKKTLVIVFVFFFMFMQGHIEQAHADPKITRTYHNGFSLEDVRYEYGYVSKQNRLCGGWRKGDAIRYVLRSGKKPAPGSTAPFECRKALLRNLTINESCEFTCYPE